jgi:hypothetical protein
MERFEAVKHGVTTRPGSLVDPCRYLREADEALRCGDRAAALGLISKAYLAFDLCSAGCRYARAPGRVSRERNS